MRRACLRWQDHARVCTPAALALLVLQLSGSAAKVRAEPSPYLGRANPLAAWMPTPEARAERERVRIEAELARLLALQPGVERAEVLLSPPSSSAVPLDREIPPARAMLALWVQREAADTQRFEQLARSVLPPGTLLHVARNVREPRQAPAAALKAAPRPAVRVGPFQVSPSSADWLRVTLAGLLASNALLAGLLLWRRARR